MVFQKRQPFPTMRFDNVAAGLRLNGSHNLAQLASVVEESLKRAALWDESKIFWTNRGPDCPADSNNGFASHGPGREPRFF